MPTERDSILALLIAGGFTTGSVVDRERARLVALTGGDTKKSLADLYKLANEPKRLMGRKTV